MTLILVDLKPGDQASVTSFFEHVTESWPAADVDILPSVYVVDYDSVEHGPACFALREDAEAFAAQRGSSVVAVPVSDSETAAEMMEQDEEEGE